MYLLQNLSLQHIHPFQKSPPPLGPNNPALPLPKIPPHLPRNKHPIQKVPLLRTPAQPLTPNPPPLIEILQYLVIALREIRTLVCKRGDEREGVEEVAMNYSFDVHAFGEVLGEVGVDKEGCVAVAVPFQLGVLLV